MSAANVGSKYAPGSSVMYKDKHAAIINDVVNNWGCNFYKITLLNNTGEEILANSLELSDPQHNIFEEFEEDNDAFDDIEVHLEDPPVKQEIETKTFDVHIPKTLRFAVKTEDDLDELAKFRHAKGTKAVTSWGVNVFKGKFDTN